MRYYKAFKHTNSSDEEEEVIKLTSSEEEKIKVVAIHIVKETNEGSLKWYVERELVGEHYTGNATIQNVLTFTVDTEMAVGKTFKITLKNVTAGVNAAVVGVVEYEITS